MEMIMASWLNDFFSVEGLSVNVLLDHGLKERVGMAAETSMYWL